jgi:OmcA/MtrC family decaheme c-type cytochrome
MAVQALLRSDGRHVMLGRETGSARAAWLAAVGLCLSVVACREPQVGEGKDAGTTFVGTRILLEDAWLDLHGHVVATFSVTDDALPLSLDEVTALRPRFTLATLSENPVDGLRAWRSRLLTGSQVAARLPPAGPGTPDPDVLTSARQPGAETPAAFVDLGGGRFRYVFAGALSPLDPDETIRVGVWLDGTTSPSRYTSSTFDFRPSGGPVDERDTVLDDDCARCHGTLALHGRRTGVRLCVTCHTWQLADPDTVDPAAMGATASTDPNPLELGRLVHRIHRGKELPTLYRSSSSAPAPALGAGNDLPPPFSPENWTTALLGAKYSVVGYQSREIVFARVIQRTENGQPPRTVVAGIVFPRDLRDCAVCHGDAGSGIPRQGYVVTTEISRRACSGCHPETWFGTAPIADQAHFAHPGGPQADDSQCAGCHVAGGAKVYAPIAEAHVPPFQSARYGDPRIRIVKVEGLSPGGRPAVTFRAKDRIGPLGPELDAPVPAQEPDGADSCLVPRKLLSFSIKVAGPASPDYASGVSTWDPITSGTAAGNPDPFALVGATVSDGADDWAEYLYTFDSTIPATARGTWTVGIEARRRQKIAHYDKGVSPTWDDRFVWPYTGESVTETPENAIAHVDTATGTWPPDGPLRRAVVSQDKCLRCHGRLELHGGLRHQIAYCLMCHNPNATDWAQRPKVGGKVSLASTWDGLEERSIHLKVMVHRIHTGGRQGAASLEAIEPHVIYGYGKNPYFFDEGGFPNDLQNCTLCHEGKSYLVESVPADAPPTVANETGTVKHAANTAAHVAGESATPPIQAACTGCHATGATIAHAKAKTVNGVETCGQCHSKGTLSVEVAHGLAPPSGGVASSFSAILSEILVPRCSGCHPAGGTPPQLDASGAYAALVNVPSGQSVLPFVKPGAPEESYLHYTTRGDAAAAGGSVITSMPPDALLDPAELSAIEAWIANGAPND